MPRDLADLAVSLGRMPEALQRAQMSGVRKAALHITRQVRTEIRADTGDMRLSGVGARGARVGARFDVKGSTNPTAIVRATGPLHLIEHPTRPHDIAPKSRRRGGGRALRLRDGTYAAHVTHPGTRAKEPFARGVNRTKSDTVRIFDEEVAREIGKAWR